MLFRSVNKDSIVDGVKQQVMDAVTGSLGDLGGLAGGFGGGALIPEGDAGIAETDIASGAGLKIIKIKFGNGSMGNRGANNRGNAFEKEFKTALDGWYAGENDPNYPTGETVEKVKELANDTKVDVPEKEGDQDRKSVV